MRKPISKHALRRAMERVEADGRIHWNEPTGTVVDQIWHELSKKAYNDGRKKPMSRRTVRKMPTEELPEGSAEVVTPNL